MLRNRATIGEHQPKRIRNGKRVPDGDPIPGFYPAAIDESLFDAAQEARQNNLASGRGRKGKPLTNLFRGIPTCAYCASRVLFKSKSNIKPYLLERDRAPGLLWPGPTRILRIRFWNLLKIARLIQQSSNRSENL
jgi:hypothetical protein